MRLWLVRHGETEWNRQARYQGHSDVPLNEEGMRQALKVAERLASEPVEAVYSSDLSRARVTAEIIAARHGAPLYVREVLRESNYGQWEGMSFKEIRERFPGSIERWLDDPEGSRPPGGESLGEVRTRALAAIKEIQARHPEDTVVVVTHGGVIAMLLMTYLGEDSSFLRRFFGKNASVSLIELEGDRAEVVCWSDASHLEE
ncbi:MAG: alpha-ribazole phosphatase [Syntrophomonadaceae bacterium]|nr:alpha-ribazole phosphatase [Syntrophomonadaceae bacterium]